jgi:hypothetical protein
MQRTHESIRSYIQRWTNLKNLTQDISEEIAIDAFQHGVHRRELKEELGRARPRTINQLGLGLSLPWHGRPMWGCLAPRGKVAPKYRTFQNLSDPSGTFYDLSYMFRKPPNTPEINPDTFSVIRDFLTLSDTTLECSFSLILIHNPSDMTLNH